jgi:hypothetical protein
MSETPLTSSYSMLPARRINLRILVFAGVLAVLVGFPLYTYLADAIRGGIRVRADGYTEVNLKAMSTFVFDQYQGTIEDVPERFRALNGKKVILEGEIWAPNAASDHLHGFELVYSIQKCCFSGPPQIQHFIQSKVVNGGKVPYYGGLVRVYGVLRVEVTKDPEAGKINGVYHLDVERLEPVT